MIKRFYADNYRTLVNFVYEPQRFELILGANGSGKTTFAQSLDAIRALVIEGLKAEDLFVPGTLTKWQNKNVQTFELELEDEDLQTFVYTLQIEHWRDKGTSHIIHEELASGGTRLFRFDSKEVHLFNDKGVAGPVFPAAWERSLLAAVPSGPSNRRLTRFREMLSQIYRVRLNPFDMTSISEREDAEPAFDLSNLASWYRHLSQQEPENVARLWESLKRVIPFFEIISMSSAGAERREFSIKISQASAHDGATSVSARSTSSQVFSLEDLSEGQRALIALYVLLHCAVKPGTTLLIDEPENFVALRELQPWLFEMQDRAEDEGGQVVLISHNPEFIDQMAPHHAVQFSRPGNFHTLVGPFKTEGFEGLTASQVVARGWNP